MFLLPFCIDVLLITITLEKRKCVVGVHNSSYETAIFQPLHKALHCKTVCILPPLQNLLKNESAICLRRKQQFIKYLNKKKATLNT